MEKESEFERLARMIKNGFDAVNERFGGVERRLDGMDERFSAMDDRFDGIDRHLRSIDQQLDGMQTTIQEHRDEAKDRFDALQKVVGSALHTGDDHEERITALEHELSP